MLPLYQIGCVQYLSYDAGLKAPADVYRILKKIGARDLLLSRPYSSVKIFNLLLLVLWVFRFIWTIILQPFNSIVFVQLPSSEILNGRLGIWFLSVMRRIKKAHVIILVHDVNDLRHLRFSGTAQSKAFWNGINSIASVLIVHNSRMADWLENVMGIPQSKMVEIGLFDYLLSTFEGIDGASPTSVTIAGNLSKWKTKYLTELNKIQGVEWELYGPYYEEDASSVNIHYHGSFSPEVIPTKLGNGFGLVWDGDSIDASNGDGGDYLQYLRYNNPHKVSLFLACGMPVIIWKEAALADFILKNNIGFVIDSLREIPLLLKSLTNEQYHVMRRNVESIATKIRTGGFLTDAVNEAFRRLRCS